MRITVVNGFFLPVPPLSGGSTEKSWYRLSREFAARGHQVTSFSRQWRDLPDNETQEGIEHFRLPGSDHHGKLWRNLLQDFFWSWRVFRKLPAADIVVCNAVLLPMWLRRLKPSAGKIVVMCGRMPKGQYRRYGRIARVLAPSRLVRERILAENAALDPVIRISGYPIDHALLGTPQPIPSFMPRRRSADEVTIGFVGRIHAEKGLMLLADALNLLASQTDLPPWRVVICGPTNVERGGSGGEFRRDLLARMSKAANGHRVHLIDPQFDDRSLAAVYQQLDIFCYPSLAEQGETFGVAIAEAMAAGAATVVSDLACFDGLVVPEVNGLKFDHRADDAPVQFARALAHLIRDPALRKRLAERGRADVKRYDFPAFAERLLEDFSSLAASPS